MIEISFCGPKEASEREPYEFPATIPTKIVPIIMPESNQENRCASELIRGK
jgi:hypothetical protein